MYSTCRLQLEVDKLKERARSDNEGMMASNEDEKRKLDELNQRLNERVKGLEKQLRDQEAEISSQRASATSADQRAATLDVALQQANASSASMASKITQMVTEANSQVGPLLR